MLSEREKRMVEVLQRLSEWNTQMLEEHPIKVLKGIVADADALLDELEVPRVREVIPVRETPTEPATASSEETSEPHRIPQPVAR